MPEAQEPSVLAEGDADLLLDGGGWISEESIRQTVRERLEQYLLLRKGLRRDVDQEVSASTRSQVEDAIVQHLVVANGEGGPQLSVFQVGAMGYPIGRGKIVKIGPTVRRGTWQSLSVIAAIVAVLHTEGLPQAIAAKRAADEGRRLVATLMSALEVLTDADERFVYDTVVALQSSYGVVDFDALQRGEYGMAFGRVYPTTADVQSAATQRVRGNLDAPDAWRSLATADLDARVAGVLAQLRNKEVLQEESGRWSVVF